MQNFYKIHLSLSWNLESPEDPLDVIKSPLLRDRIESTFGNLDGFKINDIQVKTLKGKNKKKIIGEFPLEEVFSKLTSKVDKVRFESNGKHYYVKMNSHRYFVFKNNLSCVSCGLVGTKFLLEHFLDDENPHFNLYAEENGELVLMTKDHIYPKSFGGEDRFSNYQTMCAICNNLKAHHTISLDGVKELRKLYNENKQLTRRKLNVIIEENRKKYILNKKKYKKTTEGVAAKSDIDIIRMPSGELIGMSVYENMDRKEGVHFASVKKGTILQPIGVLGKKTVFDLGNETFFIYSNMCE